MLPCVFFFQVPHGRERGWGYLALENGESLGERECLGREYEVPGGRLTINGRKDLHPLRMEGMNQN